jgi:hypothetical protein
MAGKAKTAVNATRGISLLKKRCMPPTVLVDPQLRISTRGGGFAHEAPAPKIHIHSLTLESDPKIDGGWRRAVSRGAAVHSFRNSDGTRKISAVRENGTPCMRGRDMIGLE